MFITTCLQVCILVSLYSFHMVSCQDVAEGLKNGAGQLLKHSDLDTHDVRRPYKLYNRCSSLHIRIYGKNVTALGEDSDIYTNLKVESRRIGEHFGLVIMGQRFGTYLCFNRRGKLIARFNDRKLGCLFKEEFNAETMYTMFQSLFNPRWYLGFNKRGRPLKGSDYWNGHREKCFQFLNRGHDYGRVEQRQHKYGPKISNPDLLQEYLDHHSQRGRRYVRRKIRRRPTR